MCHRRTWHDFCRSAGVDRADFSAPLIPVLRSANLHQQALETVSATTKVAIEHLGFSETIGDPTIILDYLRGAVTTDLHEGQWREKWLNVIAWAGGFRPGDESAGRAFLDALRAKTSSL